MLLIVGLFSQQIVRFNLDFDRERARALVTDLKEHFFGLVTEETGIGKMQDRFGESTISEVCFTEDTLSYQKKYDTRKDVIIYQFTKKKGDGGDFFEGGFDGLETGPGHARCVVVRVSDDFLLIPM